jgi:hypothetical protein
MKITKKPICPVSMNAKLRMIENKKHLYNNGIRDEVNEGMML